MKILLVSPYPPLRDGIANYAVQVASGLRDEGHQVTVLSSQPSAAKWHDDLRTIPGVGRTIRRARAFDRVIVQFYPELFFSTVRGPQFYRQWISATLFFRLAGNVEVLAHETTSKAGDGGRLWPRLWRAFWRQPESVVVHTQAEQLELSRIMGVSAERVQIVDHGARFKRRATLSREAARKELSIDPDVFLYLCIGFIQPHKGFDRAATALSRIEGEHLRLAIVGEVRVPTPDHKLYVDLLRWLAREDKRIDLREGYVSDDEFDTWIVAADVVVLPYRHIWSSSVVERAELYERPVIATDVGGLGSQVGGHGTVSSGPADFVEAMARHAGAPLRELEHLAADSNPADVAASLVRQRADLSRRWHDPFLVLPAKGTGQDRPRGLLSGPLMLPTPPEGHRPKAIILRGVHRLTNWELRPLVSYVNEMTNGLLAAPLAPLADNPDFDPPEIVEEEP